MLPMYQTNQISVTGSVVTINAETYTFADDAAAAAFAALAKSSMSAASEWYAGVRDLLRRLEQMLAEANRLGEVYHANELYELTLATPAENNVPGMNVPSMRSILVGSLMWDLNRWLDESVVVQGSTGATPTRRVVIGKRD